MTSWTLVINDATPSQNTRDSQHWGARRRDKSKWWWLIRANPLFLKIPPATGKRRLMIERHARGRAQDEHNVHGGCKGLVDDLTSLKLIVDDSPKWIEHGLTRHVPLGPKEKPYTVLILEDMVND